MKAGFREWCCGVVGLVVFGLAMVWPTVALLGHCFSGGPPSQGFEFTLRQWGLLGRSAWLAGAATLAALALSLPGAYAVGRMGRLNRMPWVGALLVAPLLFAPMVYVFGWQRVLPVGVPNTVQCIGIWALWAYPVPAVLLGLGWARRGRPTYEAALLETSPATAFFRAVLPLLWPHLALSGLLLFLLFLGEYSVPHACGVIVYATELLGWAAESTSPSDVLWLSLPPAVVIAGTLLVVWRIWPRCFAEAEAGRESAPVRGASWRLGLLAAGGCAVAVGVPMTALVVKLGSPAVMWTAWQTYGTELLQSMCVAGLSGVVVMLMGLGLSLVPRVERVALLWAVAFGALPGALVGEAVVSAYQSIDCIYDYWPLVVLGLVARFGWVGPLAMWLVRRGHPEQWAWQARTDGAGEMAITLRVYAALAWPTLLFGACLVMALSLSELATTTLVQVPTIGLIAHILIDKFHRFEDGMLVSLSLWLVLATVPAAVLWGVVLRRRGLD